MNRIMDSSKKSTKVQFLAPGILSRNKNKSKLVLPSFLPGFPSNGGAQELSKKSSTMPASTTSTVVKNLSSNDETGTVTNKNSDELDFGSLLKEVGKQGLQGNVDEQTAAMCKRIHDGVDLDTFLNCVGSVSKPIQSNQEHFDEQTVRKRIHGGVDLETLFCGMENLSSPVHSLQESFNNKTATMKKMGHSGIDYGSMRSGVVNVTRPVPGFHGNVDDHRGAMRKRIHGGVDYANEAGIKSALAQRFRGNFDDVIELDIHSKKKKVCLPRQETETQSHGSEDTWAQHEAGLSNSSDEESNSSDELQTSNYDSAGASRPSKEKDLAIACSKKKIDSNAKTRSVNKCKRVANLKDGQKLPLQFFMNSPVGENQTEATRHMGRLVRDRNIVPVEVHRWKDLEKSVMDHLWLSFTDKFSCDNIELRRPAILRHMKKLWQSWRGTMKKINFDQKKSIQDALKHVPQHLTKEGWEWLVKKHFLSDKFKKISQRNSENRGKRNMLHRTGSKPIKEVVWTELGARDGNIPSVSETFKMTRMRKCGTMAKAETKKYEELVQIEADQSLSRFDVIEKAFGQQNRNHVVCYGFGTKPKDVRGELPSRVELTCKLREKEKEISEMKRRLDEMDEMRRKEHMEQDELAQKVNVLMAMAFQHHGAANVSFGNK